MPQSAHIERFAPSPSGALHLGHAFSAISAWQSAQDHDGRFLLRIEDLDPARSREEYIMAIYADLRWLGLKWPLPVLRQSSRHPAYRAALEKLARRGLLYRCCCSRRDIAQAQSAPQEDNAQSTPDNTVYPGTCRNRQIDPALPFAWRLDMARAVAGLRPGALDFYESGDGANVTRGHNTPDPSALIATVGDIVLSRKDGAPAYHLAVVVDDAYQRISQVTRGCDLFPATPIQRLIQHLLGLPAPRYQHHRLIRDETGRRLAKRDDARALASLRQEGWQPRDIYAHLGL